MEKKWRKFNLFDGDKVGENLGHVFESSPTCMTIDEGVLIVGDSNGNIYIGDHAFQMSDRKYKIFRGQVKGISYILDRQKQSRQYVIAVGDDSRPRTSAVGKVMPSLTASYVIKVFDICDMSHPINAFLASPGVDANVVLTSFAVRANGNQIACGFSNRLILLFSGYFTQENFTSLKQPEAEVAFDSRSIFLPISALHFCETNISMDGVTRKGNLFNRDSNDNSNNENHENVSTNTTSGYKSYTIDHERNNNNHMMAYDDDDSLYDSAILYAVVDVDAAITSAARMHSLDFRDEENLYDNLVYDSQLRNDYPGTGRGEGIGLGLW